MVFSPHMTFLGSLELWSAKFISFVRGDAKHDRMFNVGGDRVLVVSGYWDAFVRQFGGPSGDNENVGPMELICYKRKN